MTVRSMRIQTEPDGPGRGTWWWVRIYDTAEELSAAAHRHHPWYGRAHWDGVYGCCQPAPYRERVEGNGNWEMVPPRNGQCGVIRLCRPFTYEHVAHEVSHAALATYRFVIRRDVRLGRDCGDREEDFCYIAGELLDQLIGQL